MAVEVASSVAFSLGETAVEFGGMMRMAKGTQARTAVKGGRVASKEGEPEAEDPEAEAAVSADGPAGSPAVVGVVCGSCGVVDAAPAVPASAPTGGGGGCVEPTPAFAFASAVELAVVGSMTCAAMSWDPNKTKSSTRNAALLAFKRPALSMECLRLTAMTCFTSNCCVKMLWYAALTSMARFRTDTLMVFV